MLPQLLIASAYLVCFSNAVSYASAASQQAETKKPDVNILDGTGKSIGRLRESEDRQSLILVKPDGEEIPSGSWGDDIRQEVPSPDNKFAAVVYVRNCGATTDFATRVDVVSFGKTAGQNDPNTVFVIKGDQSLKVKWDGSNKLIIQHPRTKEEIVYRKKPQLNDVMVEYGQREESAVATEYLELANFNYGLTGLVAGHNQELLLRMAGWAQEKSGLYRSQWDCWYGSPPYGDDPNEQVLIKEGFEWYRLHRDEIEKQ